MRNLFDNMGIRSEGLIHVSPREAHELCLKGACLLDVREEYLGAFKQFDVPYIIYMPLSEIGQKFAELPDDMHFIVADSVGLRSKEAAQLLITKGFLMIANLAGGMVEWDRDGLPVITDTKERLSGSCMCQLKPREKKK